MSWFVRCLMVIGAIFYLSPARKPAGEGLARSDRPTADALEQALAKAINLDRRERAQMESLWAGLPDEAKAALLDRLRRAALEPRAQLPALDQAHRGGVITRSDGGSPVPHPRPPGRP